jgi:hypothetical protein
MNDEFNAARLVAAFDAILKRGCRECGSPDVFPGVPRCARCEASYQEQQQFGWRNP